MSELLELRRNVIVVPQSEDRDTVILYRKGTTSLRLRKVGVDVLAIAEKLQAGVDRQNLEAEFGTSELVSDWLQGVIARCKESGFLHRTDDFGLLTDQEVDRFDRLLAYFGVLETASTSRFEYLRRLRTARVMVLGMGSLGSWLTYHLAANGVGDIIGCDCDTVESSNLSRQILYSEADVGRRKVDAARDAVARLTSLSQFHGYFFDIAEDTDLAGRFTEVAPDVVVLCADVPRLVIGPVVARAARQAGVVLLRANALGVGPLADPNSDTACTMCHWNKAIAGIPEAELLIRYSSGPSIPRQANSAVVSTEVGFYASLVMQELIYHLTRMRQPQTVNGRLTVEGLQPTVERRPVERDPGCSVCGPAE